MEDRLKTMTRNALKMANVVMPDCEFLKYRNVGKVTLEAINELKKAIGWIE